MIRTCAACGAKQETKNEASEKKFTWDKLHLDTCPWVKLDQNQKFDYFVENGSPLSSVVDDG